MSFSVFKLLWYILWFLGLICIVGLIDMYLDGFMKNFLVIFVFLEIVIRG